MPARLRKLIGGIGMLGYLAAYALLASALFRHLPNQPWLQLGYVAVVGTAWGVPLIPLISWMNKGS